jgi:RNA polymerase sigma factor (sigma-70 family)
MFPADNIRLPRPSILYMDDAIALPRMTTQDGIRIAAAVAEHAPRLRAFVRRQVADLSEVDDIVQDTFLELVSASRLVEPIEHLAAWLARVARNRIIDRFRARSHRTAWIEPLATGEDQPRTEPSYVLDEWLASGDSDPEAAYANSVLADELLAAIEELPVDQREVFVVHELHGRSFKEMSTETGVGINTLLGRKHAAIRFLRRRLENIRSEFDL